MGGNAICVCAWNRPEYLYITLDNLFRCDGIDEYPVLVFIDTGDPALLPKFEWVLGRWPIKSAVIRHDNLGDAANTVESLRACFEDGYEQVLLWEHDYHCTVDVLRFSESMKSGAQFFNFGRVSPVPGVALTTTFCCFGFRVPKETFAGLYPWMQSKKYLEVPLPNMQTKCKESFSFDFKFWAFCLDTGALNEFSITEDHVGSFGVSGGHSLNDAVCDKYDRIFFSGSPEHWIYNVANVLYAGDYPEQMIYHLFPRGWKRLFEELPITEDRAVRYRQPAPWPC